MPAWRRMSAWVPCQGPGKVVSRSLTWENRQYG